jgi:thymidylate synthase (FAD)
MIEATYIDHMGDDLTIVNSARVSFGKKSDWLERVYSGEAQLLPNKDIKLIHYLAKHNHKSPFNHVFTTFHVKAPIFVARQLQKHEYMPWNEISRRYVDSKPEFYEPETWRGRAKDKKQGSSDEVITELEDARWEEYDQFEVDRYDIHKSIAGCYEQHLKFYDLLIRNDVAPEQARMVLPQSTMTEWYWSGSLYAFAKMCGLRLQDDAQYETRLVAEQIEDIMIKLYPVSWEALRMYAE